MHVGDQARKRTGSPIRGTGENVALAWQSVLPNGKYIVGYSWNMLLIWGIRIVVSTTEESIPHPPYPSVYCVLGSPLIPPSSGLDILCNAQPIDDGPVPAN